MASGNVQRWERSMRYAFRGIALLFLLLGNTPPDQTPGDIIVTAPARAPKELKKQTLNFVRTVSDTAEQTQFSRRDDPFCILHARIIIFKGNSVFRAPRSVDVRVHGNVPLVRAWVEVEQNVSLVREPILGGVN